MGKDKIEEFIEKMCNELTVIEKVYRPLDGIYTIIGINNDNENLTVTVETDRNIGKNSNTSFKQGLGQKEDIIRRVNELRYIKHKNQNEIAGRLFISQSTVSEILKKTKKSVKEYYANGYSLSEIAEKLFISEDIVLKIENKIDQECLTNMLIK